jgi:hypothetical protein
VDCERDDEFVVFVKVGDIVEVRDCGVVVEFDGDIEFGVFDGIDVDAGGITGGRGISKISTTLDTPILVLFPPPKNILFFDDVDAR